MFSWSRIEVDSESIPGRAGNKPKMGCHCCISHKNTHPSTASAPTTMFCSDERKLENSGEGNTRLHTENIQQGTRKYSCSSCSTTNYGNYLQRLIGNNFRLCIEWPTPKSFYVEKDASALFSSAWEECSNSKQNNQSTAFQHNGCIHMYYMHFLYNNWLKII